MVPRCVYSVGGEGSAGRRLALVLLTSLLALSGGCERTRQGWEPPLEETSTRFLQTRVDEALRLVNAAREGLGASGGLPQEQLTAAANTLAWISEYYLPLLEARERAYNAHRLYYYGDEAQTASQLDSIERILDEVAAAGGEGLTRELKEPLDLVAELRAAMKGAPEKVPDLLKALAVRLNLMAVRGGLITTQTSAERG